MVVKTIEKYNQFKQNESSDVKKMRRTRQNIQVALDESSDIAITDRNGTITYVNDSFCKISKYSREELVGQNHRILKSGYHPPEFYKGMWHTMSKGHVWRGELKNKAKDGTFYWVKTVIVPFVDEHKRVTEYISIRTDITAQKELQEKILRAERLSAIGEMAARLGHDLRNPLTVIKGTLDLIKITSYPRMDEETKKYLERIESATRQMNNQIEEVLDFVRASPLKLDKCDLGELFSTIIEKVSIPKTINVKLPKNSIIIDCDFTKIETVFTNIITNALEAMESKGKLSIRITEQQHEVDIEIEDSGPGIPPETLPRIFDPLFTTKQLGTGLGLPSCKNIVEQHGGTIEIHTELGKGTTFTVKLPRFH